MQTTVKHTKYEYLHVVQGHYSHGWEDLTQSEDRGEAWADVRAYRENAPETVYRLIERRETRPSCSVCGEPFLELSGKAYGCPVHGIRAAVKGKA